MINILSFKNLFFSGLIALFLSGCSQKLSLNTQSGKVRYAQEQNTLPAQTIHVDEGRNESLKNVCTDNNIENTPKTPFEKTEKSASIRLNKKPGDKSQNRYVFQQAKSKMAGVIIKETKEEHFRGRKTYALHALFYAVIAAILLTALIIISGSKYAGALWIIPGQFLLVIAFLIAFFLFLVCLVSFFKVKKTKEI